MNVNMTDGCVDLIESRWEINAIRELAERPQWVVWRSEPRNGKATKIPYTPQDAKRGYYEWGSSLAHASTSSPKTWQGYTAAQASVVAGGYNGIGFVFTAGDPYCGIDLDDAIADGDASGLPEHAESRPRPRAGRSGHHPPPRRSAGKSQ